MHVQTHTHTVIYTTHTHTHVSLPAPLNPTLRACSTIKNAFYHQCVYPPRPLATSSHFNFIGETVPISGSSRTAPFIPTPHPLTPFHSNQCDGPPDQLGVCISGIYILWLDVWSESLQQGIGFSDSPSDSASQRFSSPSLRAKRPPEAGRRPRQCAASASGTLNFSLGSYFVDK